MIIAKVSVTATNQLESVIYKEIYITEYDVNKSRIRKSKVIVDSIKDIDKFIKHYSGDYIAMDCFKLGNILKKNINKKRGKLNG
jgi:hypothetical protein